MKKSYELTKAFYRFLLPDEAIIRRKIHSSYINEMNPVLWKTIILFGFPSSGKTETVRRLVEEVVLKYGRSKVNAVVEENGYIHDLIDYGLSPKMVNVLFADNLTLHKPSNASIRNFFNIRHIYRRRFNKKNGFILNILGVHRFHGAPTELRTCLDAVILRNTTLNPYDNSILTKFTSPELMKIFGQVEENRIGSDKLMEISIFATKTFKGILRTPLSTRNYLKICHSPTTDFLRMLQQVK